jgi:hypothetical protein
MERFNTRKQRLLVLFVWGPVGVLLFGVLGLLVVRDEWGLDHGGVIAGALVGAVVMAPRAVLMVVRRLSRAQARAAQDAYANREEIAAGWPEWTLGAFLALSIAIGILIDTAFGAAFLLTILTLAMVATWLAALLRRGLFQDTGTTSAPVDAQEAG